MRREPCEGCGLCEPRERPAPRDTSETVSSTRAENSIDHASDDQQKKNRASREASPVRKGVHAFVQMNQGASTATRTMNSLDLRPCESVLTNFT